MKKIILNLILVVGSAISFNAQAQDSLYVYTNGVSGPNVCDGSAIIPDSAVMFNPSLSWIWTNANGGVLQNGGLSMDSLCYGLYNLIYTDSSGTYTETFFIDTTNSNPCTGFYVNINSINASSINSCNGYVNTSISGGTAPYSYLWSNSETTSSLINLCVGDYTLVVIDNNNCQTSSTAYIYEDSSNWVTLYTNVYTNNTSADGVCDGVAYIDVYGGVPPYSFDHSNGTTEQNATNLCAGIYSVVVTDADSNVTVISYIIADPGNIINGDPYTDTTIVDTLNYGLLEDCLIDYTLLDSAFVTNIEFIGLDSILVTWSVISANNIFTYTYMLGFSPNSLAGMYELILQIFCPQRSGSDYLYAIDHVFINPASASVKGNEENLITTVYPNPFTSSLNLKLDLHGEKSNIQITDISGKIILSFETSSDEETIQMEQLAKGQYFLNIRNSVQNSTSLIIKN